MKKLIPFILLITILAGCSNAKSTHTVNNNMKPSESINQISPTLTAISVTPTATPTISAATTPDQSDDPQASNLWVGFIGASAIHAKLDITKDEVSGTYYYDKFEKDISLSGYINENCKTYSSLTMTEVTEQEGSFIAIIKNENYLEGCWKNGETIYPMYLIREGADITPPVSPSNKSMQFDGQWTGMNSNCFTGSEATIKVLFDDLFYYELFGHSGYHIGNMKDVAVLQDNQADIVFKDHVEWDNEDSDNVYFTFSMKDNNLTLDSNQYTYGCGMGVGYDSTFTKEEVDVDLPTALEVGIVDNKKQDDLFKKIVGARYDDFIGYTQYLSYEEVIMDEKTVRAATSSLRGCSGICYYINANDYLYAAIIGDSSIDYYTNDSSYEDQLPQPMQEWAAAIDLTINYYYIK